MGKLKVHVAVRTWGLPAMLDTLTVDVEDGVSEGSFKVRDGEDAAAGRCDACYNCVEGVGFAHTGRDARNVFLLTRFACLLACSFGRLVDGLKGKGP